ncbi:two-component regulator propeller domain-containing protein [Bacteroidota bacterium]
MKHLSLFLTIILISVFNSSSFSQEYFFRPYSIAQGLPQSSIYCAIEDQRGEMWIGTDGSGICRFNGIISQVMDKSDGLSGNIVRSIFEDSKGNIWIGTDNGIDKYDGYSLQSFSQTEITETTVLAIKEDKAGKIWVGTNSKGLFSIELSDSLKIKNYNIDDGLSNVFIFDIDFDKKGRIWLSLIGGINVFDPAAEEFDVTKLIEGYNIPSGFILCGDMDADGNMWFGTLDMGAFMIEAGDDLSNIKSVVPNFLDMLSAERVWDIHWTAKNECFIATEDQGVIHFDKEKVLNNFNKDNGLISNQILQVTETDNGDIWFSTLGNGILKFEDKLLIKYNEERGINGTQIFYVTKNKDGELLIGTDVGLSIYNFQDDHPVELENYTTKNGLLSNDVTSISTTDKEIWIGTGAGVSRIVNGKIHTPEVIKNGLGSNNVSCLLNDSKGNLWVGTDAGYSIYMNNELYRVNEDQGFINNEVQTIIEDRDGDIWLGTLGGLVRMRGAVYTDFVKEDGLMELNIHALAEDKNSNIWIGTFGGGIYLFNKEYDSIPIRRIAGNEILSSNNIYSLKFLSDSVLIAATESGFDQIYIDENNNVTRMVHFDVNDGFAGGGNKLNALHVDENFIVWFGNGEGLVRYNPNLLEGHQKAPDIQITDIKLFYEAQDWSERGETKPWFNLPENLVLPHTENYLTIGFSCVYYGNHADLSYSYFMDGLRGVDWSPFVSRSSVDFPGLRPGKYNFMVRVKDKYGNVSDVENFSFITVRPPFWMQPWFIALVIIVLIAAVIIIIRQRTQKLIREKIELEKIVAERTREVVEQKEEIEKQHKIVVEQNDEIESSIHYAEKIQKAVIPSQEILTRNFDDSFILWRPQHIVSGDFYWIGQKGDYVIFTAADCTGHGVPGAFMSMLGVSYLNQIILEENTFMPDKILCKLRTHIINSFSLKDSDEADRKDGMDITLCAFNTKTKKLYFAGAYNPLYVVRKNGSEPEIIEFDADKMPVGLYARMDDYKLTEVDYIPGDTLYLFSDGFPDQFGGERFKKFMKKRFKEMLLSNQEKTLGEQREIYNDVLEEWMSYKDPEGEEIIQTDDVLLIGVRL